MVSNTETPRGGAAVKEGCRILATTFLSLLLPLSFLLLARLSTSRYFLSITNDDKFSSLNFHGKKTLILSLLVFAVAIAALIRGLTGNKDALLVNERRRLYAAWVLLSLLQVCLSLGIHGTVDAEINCYTVGNLVLPTRMVFALGLHEIMIFWRRNVVKPVVDDAIFGFSNEGFGWVEKVVLAVAFGNLWWRSLRDEAEALVVMVELRMDVEAVDVLGWLLYYLTAAIGVVRVVKVFLWGGTTILRHRHQTVKTVDKATKDIFIKDMC